MNDEGEVKQVLSENDQQKLNLELAWGVFG